MATESSWAKWSNPATNNEWPSGGGCCSAPVWFVWLGCSVSSCCFCSCCCCSQAALPFPDLPFVCSFTFFIVSALRVVVSVVVGLTALCLVDFSCMCASVCVCSARSAAATNSKTEATPTPASLESFKQNVAKVFNILYGVSGFL